MQVLFPKHAWLHTEYMPTLHWRTGASYLSLSVITVAWWIASGILIHHRSNAYEFFLLVLATLHCRYWCHSCYCYSVATAVTLLLLLSLCCYWLLLLLLLSHYFATDTLLQILSLSGVVELTTQLLILENILWLPLVSNQQIWVEYSTLWNLLRSPILVGYQ